MEAIFAIIFAAVMFDIIRQYFKGFSKAGGAKNIFASHVHGTLMAGMRFLIYMVAILLIFYVGGSFD